MNNLFIKDAGIPIRIAASPDQILYVASDIAYELSKSVCVGGTVVDVFYEDVFECDAMFCF